MDPRTQDKPVIWAHVADQSDRDGVAEVVARLNLEGIDADLFFTGPSDLSTGDLEVHPIESVDLNKLEPKALVWLDNEVSSRVLAQCHREGVPVILANLNTAALQSTPEIWAKPLAKSSLKPVRFALVQSDKDRDYLVKMGFARHTVQVTGVLQGCGLPPSYDASERQDIVKALTGCPIWFARGVPMSELDIVLDAAEHGRRRVRRLILFLDPEDEKDAPAMAEAARQRGLTVHERAVEGLPDATTHVFVTDGAFERGLWYSLAAATYLGGTFNGSSCRNPLVSAAVGTALLVGPNPPLHHAAFNRMDQSGALNIVTEPEALGTEIARCVRPETAAGYAHAGWKMVANAAEGLDRTIDLLKDILAADPD